METGESSINQPRKRTRGRQKTQLRLVPKEEDRLITFSKRKAGINKKATELCVMCNAQAVFILFSPKGNAFSFGHPDVKSVVNKFLGREDDSINGDPRVIDLDDAHTREKNEELVDYHNMLQFHVNQFIQHRGIVKQMAESRGDRKGWWDTKVEDLKTAEEVKELFKNIVAFQEALCHHMEMLQLVGQSLLPTINPPSRAPFHGHSSAHRRTLSSPNAQMTELGGDASSATAESNRLGVGGVCFSNAKSIS